MPILRLYGETSACLKNWASDLLLLRLARRKMNGVSRQIMHVFGELMGSDLLMLHMHMKTGSKMDETSLL